MLPPIELENLFVQEQIKCILILKKEKKRKIKIIYFNGVLIMKNISDAENENETKKKVKVETESALYINVLIESGRIKSL